MIAAVSPRPAAAPETAAARSAEPFGGVFLVWLGLYLALVLAWGQRNSWPDELLVCLLFLPLQAAVAVALHVGNGFGRDGRDDPSHRELAIAYLLLATGIASGLLLMMTVGLLAVGVAWLRPRRRPVDWYEWLKLPVLFSLALPFWLDFSGSRQQWLAHFDDPAVNPVYRLPLELGITRLQVALRLAVLAAALLLPGRRFWWALPLLVPAVVAGNELAARFAAGAAAAAWLAMAGAGLAVAALVRRLDGGTPRPGDGHLLYWMEHRAYPPWIAALAVAVQQAVPAEGPSVQPRFGLALLGTAALVVLLYRLRRRTPAGPIHSRSSAMVMGGLALLLSAEFTGVDLFRYAALGATVIGLMSWHRLWAKRVFLAAAATWLALLPPAVFGFTAATEPTTLFLLRAVVAVTALVLLARAGPRTDWASAEEGYANETWQPLQRFALICLLLLLMFQNAAAFWPEPEENRFELALRGASAAELLTAQSEAEAAPAIEHLSLLAGYRRFTVSISRPSRNPSQLEAPELALRRRGWHIDRREVTPHPHGIAVALTLERGGQPARAVYWFENGGRAFVNYLQARRILWSSWNLSDRNLRLVIMVSGGQEPPEEFFAFARQQDWFVASAR